mmetsp:Transcript_129200/g.414197  ORF Transcript_129200/g.414197 Transcript_129200/m.414197 type:complete len:312 (+) Transcript_129200:138-1073(+)
MSLQQTSRMSCQAGGQHASSCSSRITCATSRSLARRSSTQASIASRPWWQRFVPLVKGNPIAGTCPDSCRLLSTSTSLYQRREAMPRSSSVAGMSTSKPRALNIRRTSSSSLLFTWPVPVALRSSQTSRMPARAVLCKFVTKMCSKLKGTCSATAKLITQSKLPSSRGKGSERSMDRKSALPPFSKARESKTDLGLPSTPRTRIPRAATTSAMAPEPDPTSRVEAAPSATRNSATPAAKPGSSGYLGKLVVHHLPVAEIFAQRTLHGLRRFSDACAPPRATSAEDAETRRQHDHASRAVIVIDNQAVRPPA